jgi:hypothetical protein
MGIFGNKKPDTSLSGIRHDHQRPMVPPSEMMDPPLPVAPAPTPSVIVNNNPEPERRYGIEETIKLMRSLPVSENADLVMRVVRTTLESMNVRVTDILSDAERKEVGLRERVGVLKSAISEFEQEIQVRREEISRLEMDLSETSGVKTRLSAVDDHGAVRLTSRKI